MGGATIWPVPRAMDAEAHYYPRRWKRNWIFLYGGLFLTGIQINRYAALHRVSYALSLQNKSSKTNLLRLSFSNRLCARANTWIGEARMLQSASGSTERVDLAAFHHSLWQTKRDMCDTLLVLIFNPYNTSQTNETIF